jgi:hypothetical protein
MTAEGQNLVVVLRGVNILAAAQTDGHVSGASRTARVIELPFVAFANELLNYSILRLVGPEARISFALACPRFNRRGPPRGMVAGNLACAAVSTARVGVRA